MTLQEIVDHAKEVVPRCLSPDEREKAFLDLEPPDWCVQKRKWPYDSPSWVQWLANKRAGAPKLLNGL
jgi:hypothetical protein